MSGPAVDFDVVIVGAGLSGIGSAYHVKTACPQLSYAVLEGRARLGGTWDLFRYPGIRSDSDMYTFGFGFHPWRSPRAISPGADILAYAHETVDAYGLRQNMQFETRVEAADWDSTAARWTLTLARGPERRPDTLTCRFLLSCTGYYDYESGYRPAFPGEARFRGPIVHPQHWDPEIDYADKRVVLIGSGATAVTMLPELAKTAREVVMLQRSPTYVTNLPTRDAFAEAAKRVLPQGLAHRLVRWKNILVGIAFYRFARSFPGAARRLLQRGVRKSLGEHFDARHFTPRYDPWDQRLCVVPDGDFFAALKSGRARIVTDTIATFTETGIRTAGGEKLAADLVIAATGLTLKAFGGATFRVDGEVLDTAATHVYRGAMLSGVPNFAAAIGYTNAPWTLKVDLVGRFVTRLLNHLHARGYRSVTPRFDAARFGSRRLLDFDAGYILRGAHIMPRQGSARPWRVYENYLRDYWLIARGSVRDQYLEYA